MTAPQPRSNITHRQQAARLVLLAAVVPLLAPPFAQAEANTKPTNVVLIMADDFGYECVGANGSESYATPNLDQLAAEGVRFTRCHVQPLCTPTRVELMTGLSNVRNYDDFGILPESARTFAHIFRSAGYTTGICGKWQLGKRPGLPNHFGFDESLLWQQTRRPPRYANPGLERQGKEEDYHQGEYGPDLINEFACDFISRHRERPFLLYYPMILTHDPFQPTPASPDWDPTAQGEKVHRDLRHFGEMVRYADAMVGKVMQALQQAGVADNTLLIFLGDNGTHRTVTSRFHGADYQGGKGQTNHRGTHVPCIVRWPAAMDTPSVCDDLVTTVDFLPTITAAAGLEPFADLDGISFMPQLKGLPGSPRSWIYSWYSPRIPKKGPRPIAESVCDGRFKRYRSGELYDVIADPEETTPLNEDTLDAQAEQAVAALTEALTSYDHARPRELGPQHSSTR